MDFFWSDEDDGRLFPFVGAPRRFDMGPLIPVRFYNDCQFPVDLFEMDYNKEPCARALIPYKKFFDVRIHKDCPWVARRRMDGLKTLLNGELVFNAKLENEQGEPERQIVTITPKEQTLTERAIRCFVMKDEKKWRSQLRLIPDKVRNWTEKIGTAGLEYRRLVCHEFVEKAIKPKSDIQTNKRLREIQQLEKFEIELDYDRDLARRLMLQTEAERVSREATSSGKVPNELPTFKKPRH